MPSARRIGISVEFHLPFKHHVGIVAGVHRFADERGWIPILDEWVEATIADARPGQPPYDGVIARVGGRRLKVAEATAKAGIPLVNVRAMSPLVARLPGVFPDFELLGRMQAEHLMARGFRHFAHAAPCKPPYTTMGASFAATVSAAGHSITRLALPDTDDESRAGYRSTTARLRAWLDRWELPIGVATGGAPFARRLADLCHERGWKVPRDVAIVAGANEENFCERPHPALTAVELGYERVGYEAARLLESLMGGPKPFPVKGAKGPRPGIRHAAPPPPHVMLPPVGIIVRESTDFLASDDPLITAALGYIAEHFPEPLRVGEIAAQFDVCTKTLQNRFAAVLKRSVAQEIRRVRIEAAKRELTTTDRPIAEVAARTGFATNVQLCAVFRRELGVSPSAYRSTRSVPRA